MTGQAIEFSLVFQDVRGQRSSIVDSVQRRLEVQKLPNEIAGDVMIQVSKRSTRDEMRKTGEYGLPTGNRQTNTYRCLLKAARLCFSDPEVPTKHTSGGRYRGRLDLSK